MEENGYVRDENDMREAIGLKIADDAVIIDNTNMTIEETFLEVKKMIEQSL